MAMLIARPYAGEPDLEPIAALLNACAIFDRSDGYYTVAELRTAFTAPGFDATRDLQLWQNTDQQLIACGRLWFPDEQTYVVEGYLGFWVHPNERGRGLEAEVLTWAEAQLRSMGQALSLPARLGGKCRDDQPDGIALFEQHGFQYVRSFLKMSRSLAEPLPEPVFPAGFALDHVRGEQDAAAWVEMFNETFIDHWNFHSLTVEGWLHWHQYLDYRAELDLVAIDSNGTFAAFCYCSLDTEYNAQHNCRQGWINSLGTRRGFRRLGLARAMLLSGMHQLRAVGMETALLHVDLENPNQALRLYESVGFCRSSTDLCYSKAIEVC